MKNILFTAFIGLMLLAAPAHAMHLSEGILPMKWAVIWYLVALPFVAYGVYKVKAISKEDLSIKPMLGMMGGSCIYHLMHARPCPHSRNMLSSLRDRDGGNTYRPGTEHLCGIHRPVDTGPLPCPRRDNYLGS